MAPPRRQKRVHCICCGSAASVLCRVLQMCALAYPYCQRLTCVSLEVFMLSSLLYPTLCCITKRVWTHGPNTPSLSHAAMHSLGPVSLLSEPISLCLCRDLKMPESSAIMGAQRRHSVKFQQDQQRYLRATHHDRSDAD